MTSPDMRVSDAERSEVADALSRHFSDGRLDQAEFDERLHHAMSAKTRGDLAGLLADLPPLVPPAPQVAAHRHRSRFVLLVVVTFLFFAAAASSAWDWRFHFPWLLAAVVFFLLWRRSRWHSHRHHRWPRGWDTPLPPPPAPGDAQAWAARRRGWWV